MNPADANVNAIAAAGVLIPLIALLASPSVEMQRAAADTLYNMSSNGTRSAAAPFAAALFYILTFLVPADAANIAIIAAGAVPPLITLITSLSVDVQVAVADALAILAHNNGTCARAVTCV